MERKYSSNNDVFVERGIFIFSWNLTTLFQTRDVLELWSIISFSNSDIQKTWQCCFNNQSIF